MVGAVLAALVVAGAFVVLQSAGSASSSATPTSAPPSSAPPSSDPGSPAPGSASSAMTTAPSTSAAEFDRTARSVDDPDSIWVVSDKLRPLDPVDYAPDDLVPVGGGRQLRAAAATALQKMFTAAAARGLTLNIDSAYRSYDYQVGVFDRQVTRFGETIAERQVAKPGYSEHQTGLAADIGGGGCEIETCFATTAEGRWVAANGYRYGFVIRYPDGDQSVTGFKYEPWHVRYVGVALATELHRTGTDTLEEFFDLPDAPDYPS